MDLRAARTSGCVGACPAALQPWQVKDDEMFIYNDEFGIKNDEFCIENDDFCICNDELVDFKWQRHRLHFIRLAGQHNSPCENRTTDLTGLIPPTALTHLCTKQNDANKLLFSSFCFEPSLMDCLCLSERGVFTCHWAGITSVDIHHCLRYTCR